MRGVGVRCLIQPRKIQSFYCNGRWLTIVYFVVALEKFYINSTGNYYLVNIVSGEYDNFIHTSSRFTSNSTASYTNVQT